MHTYDRNYFKIALPAALEGLFMILLASTDLIMVGALGALSIAAVSIFLQPRLILLCFSRSLASSVTLLVSEGGRRRYGRLGGYHEEIAHALRDLHGSFAHPLLYFPG